jgi:hypothetical protein
MACSIFQNKEWMAVVFRLFEYEEPLYLQKYQQNLAALIEDTGLSQEQLDKVMKALEDYEILPVQ